MPSKAILDLFAKSHNFALISALVSLHFDHSSRAFHDCGLQSGQIMTNNATYSSLVPIRSLCDLTT